MNNPYSISKKCVYALRALLYLALQAEHGPVSVSEIAKAQAIPVKYLEIILNELRHGGFVESRRGNGGGFVLNRTASQLSVGQVIDFLQGRSEYQEQKHQHEKARFGDYVLSELWRQAGQAVSKLYYEKSFADLVEEEQACRNHYVHNYVI